MTHSIKLPALSEADKKSIQRTIQLANSPSVQAAIQRTSRMMESMLPRLLSLRPAMEQVMKNFQPIRLPNLEFLQGLEHVDLILEEPETTFESPSYRPATTLDQPTLDAESERKQLTSSLKETWDALDNVCLSQKNLALKLNFDLRHGGAARVRRRIKRIRKLGYVVENRPGHGYFRPDAPPQN